MRWIFVFILCILLLAPMHAKADSFYSNGHVHNTSGSRSNILFYKHFNISADGHVTGKIVNKSNRPIRGLVLDMYTMDIDETRVLWSKIIEIGDMAPRSEYSVSEPYSPVPDDPNKVVFRFKIHGSDEYRIPTLRK
ncbi:MAG: hypothetical protein ACP5IL_00880 [Syntrophobacteraceae bacterium]